MDGENKLQNCSHRDPFFSIYQGDGRGLLDFINLVPGISSWDDHFQHSVLLGRGRSQTGGFFSNIYKKFKKTQEKDCRDWAKRQKQKGGRASFHDDIFS